MTQSKYESPSEIDTPSSEETILQINLQEILKQEDPNIFTSSIERLYGCNREEAEIVKEIIWVTKSIRQNPTIGSAVSKIINTFKENAPLSFILSQCIGKKNEFRSGKFQYFTQSKVQESRLPNGISTMLEKKGWDTMKEIKNITKSKISIVLGDKDFSTIDSFESWVVPEDIEKFQYEVKEMAEKTQEEADAYFGLDVASIQLWSSMYNLDYFRNEYQKALDTKEKWLTGKFLRGSQRPYLRSWGYEELAKNLGIEDQKLLEFIELDIIRTAAQYRIEANIVSQHDKIQCWAETCADPIWPINISNYDKQGVPPSLIIV